MCVSDKTMSLQYEDHFKYEYFAVCMRRGEYIEFTSLEYVWIVSEICIHTFGTHEELSSSIPVS